MKNDYADAPDAPVGQCTVGGCDRWPELEPAPCCWLSCSELCGGACMKWDQKYGEDCEFFGGERHERDRSRAC